MAHKKRSRDLAPTIQFVGLKKPKNGKNEKTTEAMTTKAKTTE
jgi:hypothetical protein